jgi:hypothetical protein
MNVVAATYPLRTPTGSIRMATQVSPDDPMPFNPSWPNRPYDLNPDVDLCATGADDEHAATRE